MEVRKKRCMENKGKDENKSEKVKKISVIPTGGKEVFGTVEERNKRGRPSKVKSLQRNRTDSVGSILDFYTRKRERIEEEGEEEEVGATRKRCYSVSAQLSPTKKVREREIKSAGDSMDIEKLESMTDLKQMIIMLAKSMSTKEDLREEMRQLRKSFETEREADREKIEKIDKKVDRRCEEIEKKIEAITKKGEGKDYAGPETTKETNGIIKRMEDFMEKKERKERKNNIIIRGLKGEEMGEALRKKVEGFIRDRIKVKAEVKFARRIGNRNMILAKIDTFEGKIKIMVNKKILGTEDIYI